MMYVLMTNHIRAKTKMSVTSIHNYICFRFASKPTQSDKLVPGPLLPLSNWLPLHMMKHDKQSRYVVLHVDELVTDRYMVHKLCFHHG